MRFTAELIGCIGLTSAAPGAYYVATGHFDSTAFILWVVNLVFVVNQVQFVHLRIHTAHATERAVKFVRGRHLLLSELVTVLMLALGWRVGLLPGLTRLAFAPILLRGVFWFLRKPSPLDVHRLGVSELVHAVFFGALVITSFAVARLRV